MIVEVNTSNIISAAQIHSLSWKESHKSFCSESFVEKHTVDAQVVYLTQEMQAGKKLYMLLHEYPVGIVSVFGNIIENLYVLPSEQGNGYGSELLAFALSQCIGTPTLWVLSNNDRAYQLYTRYGFKKTGNQKQLNDNLFEFEMCFSSSN